MTTTTKGTQMFGKIAGAVLASAVALSALTGCTEADQRIASSFTEPRMLPSKTVEVRDPSLDAKVEPIDPTTDYYVKIWGGTEKYLIYVDGTQVNDADMITVPLRIKVHSKEDRITVIAQSQSYRGKKSGCTITDDAGTILDTKNTKKKNTLFTCTIGD